eukprot:7598087-Pyramimonas_sp.AAC.1
MFVGGCFLRHEISELSRAGYGLVALGEDGHGLGRPFGPIHAPFPQTSQCSEFAGIARCGMEIGGAVHFVPGLLECGRPMCSPPVLCSW